MVFLLIDPSMPEELTVAGDGVTETKVPLSWKGPTPPDSSILEYEVQYRKPGEDLKKMKSSTCQCEVIGLAAATNYQFRVAAINSVGCGAFTDFVTQSTRCKLHINFIYKLFDRWNY